MIAGRALYPQRALRNKRRLKFGLYLSLKRSFNGDMQAKVKPAPGHSKHSAEPVSQPKAPCLIFDMDNVLIDTRRSYLDAIRWTVEIFLTHSDVPFYEKSKKAKPPAILTLQDVSEFKLLGGFNDDWDCCYGLLIYLLSIDVRKRTVEELRAIMDIPGFVKRVKNRPLRVSGIVKMLGRPGGVTIEKISRIFQEVYLGKDLFHKLEKKRPYYWKKSGLIYKEKPIFRKSTLERLKALGIKLGIATGRSRFEAEFALERFGIRELFDAITTMDEIKEAEHTAKQSLRKPHPFSVLETARLVGAGHQFYYVGDLPDDVHAANEAKKEIPILSVGFPWYSANPASTQKEMSHAGADIILDTPSKILDVLRQKS